MSARLKINLPWLLAVTETALLIVGISLILVYPARIGDIHLFNWIYLLSTLVFAFVGALIASQQPRNIIGWLFLATGFCGALLSITDGYTGSYYIEDRLPLTPLVSWLDRWILTPTLTLPTVFVFMLFPDGHLPSRRWTPVALCAVLGLVGQFLSQAFYPFTGEGFGPFIQSFFAVPGARRILETVQSYSMILLTVGGLGAVLVFVSRFRHSRGIEREQMKWLAFAGSITSIGFAVGISAEDHFSQSIPAIANLGYLFGAIGLIAIPIAVGIAILRFRLYDIDLIINRALVYGSLTLLITAVYILLVGGIGSLVANEQAHIGAFIITTVMVALGVRPLHRRLQNRVDNFIPISVRPSAPEHAKKTVKMRQLQIMWAINFLLMATVLIAGIVVQINSGFLQIPGKLPDAIDIASYIQTIVFVGMGLFIFWRKSGDVMGVWASWMLIAAGVGMSSPVVMLYQLEPFRYFPVTIVHMGLVFAVILFLFIFPDGRFYPKWTERIAAFSIVALLLALVIFIFDRNLTTPVMMLFLLVGTLGGMVAQIIRYSHSSNDEEKRQTILVIIGFLLAGSGQVMISVLIGMGLAPSDPANASLWHKAVGLILGVMPMFVPLTIGIAIFRYRLWQLDIIVNRSLVYGGLSLAIITIYAVTVGTLSLLFQGQNSLLISLLATGLIAVLFQPVRERLQRTANRLLYGDRDDPYAALSRLGQRLESTLASDAVLNTIVETVAQTLKLPYAAISLSMSISTTPNDQSYPMVATWGSQTKEILQLPLTYQGESIGSLIVGSRAGEAFSPADRHLLNDLARQAGVAVHAVRLTTDLQRSRERLVTTREEERRRLRRDLHDGLGSHLAALHLQLDTLRMMIPAEAENAQKLVLELREEVHDAIADIRRLVYELRPPALDELGLAGALRQLATQWTTSNGLEVAIKANEPLPPLPAAVEVAAYRIAQEALTNVAHHAQAHQCLIRVDPAEELMLEIIDDGIGLPAKPHASVGLRSMRERAAELGGTFNAEKVPTGGTRISVSLPLPEQEE